MLLPPAESGVEPERRRSGRAAMANSDGRFAVMPRHAFLSAVWDITIVRRRDATESLLSSWLV